MSSDIESFKGHLAQSTHVLTLIGAGLSAASGLPTFRGAGGIWKDYAAKSLATPQAFAEDPGLVWQFYAYRRHMALKAKPNPAHFALAELARKMDGKVKGGGSLTLSQNVDGLSPRANHPPHLLLLLHGNLFDIKCSNRRCDYLDKNNFTDPLCPALEVSSISPLVPSPSGPTGATATQSLASSLNPLSNNIPYTPNIPPSSLPHCPKCSSILRPAIVWFGEALPTSTLANIDSWITSAPQIDLMIVVGTTAEVFPAAGYIDVARAKGARIAVVNVDDSRLGTGAGLDPDRDWLFLGDAGVSIPRLLEHVVGKLDYEALVKGA